jgi:hypothetical protein
LIGIPVCQPTTKNARAKITAWWTRKQERRCGLLHALYGSSTLMPLLLPGPAPPIHRRRAGSDCHSSTPVRPSKG